MRRQMFGTSLAVLAATAFISAQAPAQSPSVAAPPAYEQQLVTVEGCLRRERAPDEAALEVSADPERNVMFVLGNAELRSRTDTKPAGGAETDPALGPAGRQNERVGLPGDGRAEPPAADPQSQAGTAAIDGAPTPAADRYVIVGLEDDRLRLFTGQRVEMEGQFEPPAASVSRNEAEPAAVGTSGRPGAAVVLPRFRATSVKPVAGVCVPKP